MYTFYLLIDKIGPQWTNLAHVDCGRRTIDISRLNPIQYQFYQLEIISENTNLIILKKQLTKHQINIRFKFQIDDKSVIILDYYH